MRQRTKLPLTALQVDGGVAINNELLSLLASVLEIEVHRPPSIERTALGIAALAGLELGWWSSPEAIPLQDQEHTDIFLPQTNQVQREILLHGWHRAISCALGNQDSKINQERGKKA
jgi:glycerol kinase